MSKFSILVSLSFFLPILNAIGQETTVSFESIYGTYQMKDFSRFQNELFYDANTSLDVPFKKVNNFDGYLGYELSVRTLESDIYFGIEAAYRTTGGRIRYADYSGYSNIDNELSLFELCGLVGFQLFKKGKFDVVVNGRLGTGWTKHVFSSELTLYNKLDQKESYKFASKNLIIGLGSNLRYFVSKRIFINVPIRYDLHIPGDLKFKGGIDGHLTDKQGDKIKANWSGLRIGIGIGYSIN